MKPTVIEFNGLGQPIGLPIRSGHVALLIQGERKEVVRIESLPPESRGPCLRHASNSEELREDIARFWASLDVSDLLAEPRQWVIDCPPEISRRAVFR